MLVIETEKYVRKPLYVNAVRVTEENFSDVLAWCEGTLETESGGPREGKQFIKVNVHGVPKSQRQTKAFAGDWLLHTERGFKVYTDNAFRASFDPVATEPYTAPNVYKPSRPTGVVTPPNNATQPIAEGIEATLERAPMVSDSPSGPPRQTEDGRRILTSAEQLEMAPAEITELLRSGQVVLAQDLV